MADNSSGVAVWVGTTSYSTDVILRSSVDGTEMTGLVAATLTASYWRQGGVRVAITLSNLAAVNSVYSSGGVKEVDSTNMKGTYRLDVPDAAFVTGADWVQIEVFATGSYVFKERFALQTNLVTTLAAITAKVAPLTATVANKIDATIQLATDFAQGAADRIWLSTIRQLTSFGFNVSLTSSVWDESGAGHNTAGTMGKLLNTAGTAADPLLNTVPGAYGAGTAGFVIGNIANNTAAITAIGNVTSQFRFTTPNVVDSSAAGGLTVAAVAAAVWAQRIETQGNLSAQVVLDTILAICAGVTSVDGLTFRTPDGTQIRAVITTDQQNNRLTVALTPSAP